MKIEKPPERAKKSPAVNDPPEKRGLFTYEVSRTPREKHRRKTAAKNNPLFTPSGGRVPPAWTGLWLTTDPENPLQAIGYDSKGRRVYLYSAAHMGEAAAAKFRRLREFSRAYPALVRRVKKDLPHSEEAKVLYLILKTGFRIGSDAETKAGVKAFGASTLRCSQVTVRGDSIYFDFTGKKGIRVNKELRDGFLAQHLSARCFPDTDQKIFNTTDDRVRQYLGSISRGLPFTVKDFRTYIGTLIAFKQIKSIPAPANVTQFKRYRREVGKVVGRELGNTPAIALNSYVSPEVFCAWEAPTDKKESGTEKRVSLNREFLDCIHYDRKAVTLKPAAENDD
ncbi:MAG: hypothetical protein PHE50_08040 [Dehalococcoidales bacterium]|nr:hypothetical protein [Dehalococcoidales bacterium]